MLGKWTYSDRERGNFQNYFTQLKIYNSKMISGYFFLLYCNFLKWHITFK